MQDKILIFGNGQIGNAYYKYFTDKGISIKIASTDITKIDEVEKEITQFKPTVVINTAAKTNLEWCSNNKLEAFNVNVLGADNVAQICDKHQIYFIHFSSGCIFSSRDENDRRKEDDIPDPTSYYSWTKVWSEQLIKFRKSENFKYLILRPRQPISAVVHFKNMLVKFLTFTKFIDVPNTGTIIEDLMLWTDQLLAKKPVGTLHVANHGWSTPYDIALLIKKHVMPDLPIEKISKAELNKLTPNTRIDTVMDVSKLEGMGIEVREFNTALEDTIIKLGQNIKKMDKATLKEQLELTLEQSKMRTVVNDVWSNLLK